MDEITVLTEINFASLFLQICSVVISLKVIVSAFEWLINRIGLETRTMREKREEHELLIQTNQNLSALQKKHEEDLRLSSEQLSVFMGEIRDSIKRFADGEKDKSGQIEALMCGSKELLGAEIDKRYREYVALGGIPESDVDEFDDIHTAYNRLNGNHRRDTKYYYVKDHLPVIPVETKLITNHQKYT